MSPQPRLRLGCGDIWESVVSHPWPQTRYQFLQQWPSLMTHICITIELIWLKNTTKQCWRELIWCKVPGRSMKIAEDTLWIEIIIPAFGLLPRPLVTGLATNSPCGVWGHGWTNCLLCGAPMFLNESWCVSLTYKRSVINLIKRYSF